jgi:hypothetical protein
MGTEMNTLILGWNRACIGREAAAAELFGQTMAYWEKCQKAGKITSCEPCLIAPHGGDLNGFFFVKGTHQNLMAIQADGEFQDIMIRAGLCLEGFGMNLAWSGVSVGELMTRWAKAIPR